MLATVFIHDNMTMLVACLQAVIVMSDNYQYTLAGQTLGSARQPLDILYIPAVLTFSAVPVSPEWKSSWNQEKISVNLP